MDGCAKRQTNAYRRRFDFRHAPKNYSFICPAAHHFKTMQGIKNWTNAEAAEKIAHDREPISATVKR